MKNKITKGVIAVLGTSMLLTGCGTLNKENQEKLGDSVKQTTEMRNQLEKYSRELADSKIDNEEFKHKMKQEFDKYIDEQSAELEKKAEKTKKMTEILRNKLDEALMEMDELDQDEIEKEPGEPLPETIPYLPESGYPEQEDDYEEEPEENQNKEEYTIEDGKLIPRNKSIDEAVDEYFEKMEKTPRILEDTRDASDEFVEKFLKSPEDLEEFKDTFRNKNFTSKKDLEELKVAFINPFTNKEVTDEDMEVRGNKLTYKYNVMQIGKDLNQEGKFLQVDVRLKQSNVKEDKHETSTTYNGKESRTTIKKSFGVKGKDGKEYIVDLVFNGVKGRLEAEKSVEELVESIEINS